jgi:hypothetical protein
MAALAHAPREGLARVVSTQLAITDAPEVGLPPGIYGIPADTYHADDLCPAPTLSASIAHVMCSRSPRHAREAHPRLNPAHERVDEPRFDLGTTVHALLLNGDQACRVVDAQDWRTKPAREARDQARADGLIPMLADQWAAVQEMVAAVREQLPALDADPPLLADGRPEQTLVWEENGVTCRARLDWFRDDHAAVDDVKTTTASANPADWTRRMFTFGADVQVAMYKRGVRALTGTDPAFRFLVCETDPPYAVSVVGLAPSALALAEEKVSWSIGQWRECLRAGEWPGYTRRVAYAELNPYEELRWADARELEEQEAEAA